MSIRLKSSCVSPCSFFILHAFMVHVLCVVQETAAASFMGDPHVNVKLHTLMFIPRKHHESPKDSPSPSQCRFNIPQSDGAARTNPDHVRSREQLVREALEEAYVVPFSPPKKRHLKTHELPALDQAFCVACRTSFSPYPIAL